MNREKFYKKYSQYQGMASDGEISPFPSNILYYLNHYDDCITLYYENQAGHLLYVQVDLDYFQYIKPDFSITEWEVFEKELEELFPTSEDYQIRHLR